MRVFTGCRVLGFGVESFRVWGLGLKVQGSEARGVGFVC